MPEFVIVTRIIQGCSSVIKTTPVNIISGHNYQPVTPAFFLNKCLF